MKKKVKKLKPDAVYYGKSRRHHNNKGYTGIKSGSHIKGLERIARSLKINFVKT